MRTKVVYFKSYTLIPHNSEQLGKDIMLQGFYNIQYIEEEPYKPKVVTTKIRRQMLLLSGEEIRAKHAELEQKHYEYCSINREVCKLWPEVQIIPEYHCKRFFKRILPSTQDLSMVSAKIHHVILNYTEIKNENNGTHDSVAVNATACRIPRPLEGRRYVHFIRAPSFPICVFYIFREMLSTEHVNIAEEICDSNNQEISIYHILSEFEKFHAWENVPMKRRKILQVQYGAFERRSSLEQKHYEAYILDRETLTQWPESHSTPDHICGRFLQKIITNIEELTLVTGSVHEVVLYYTEIQDEVNRREIEAIRLNATQCRLAKQIKRYRFVHLVRSPSYPDCVLLLSRLQNMHDKYYISEEICESTNFISFHRIVSNVVYNASKNGRRKRDDIAKLEEYEYLHHQYYQKQRNDCEEWPELDRTNKKDICQAFISQIHPRTIEKRDIEAESKPLRLKYCIKKSVEEETFGPKYVKCLVCTVSLIQPPNRFHFIKMHKPNCVYWAKRLNRHRQIYFIAKEICVNELLCAYQIGVDLNIDDDVSLNNFLCDNKFMEYLRENEII